MPEISLPYHKSTLEFEIASQELLGVYHAALPEALTDAAAAVEQALDNPIDSLMLEELARNKRNAVVIASDHTRPVPSKILMPALLRRLRKNAPDIDITILIATGCHRATTREELINKFGRDIVENEKIVIHDCSNEDELVDLGTLPSGGRLRINKLAFETELLLSEGFIEPHFFAGFSGGRKSVLPGIAARETVLANHCSEFIRHSCSRTGILQDNPIHNDMLYAAKKANLQFILNVVLNSRKEVVNVFAGNMEKAHLAGCEYLKELCRVKVPPVDAVITTNGGYPLDQNVYQSVKGMTAGEAVCRPGGVIIIAAGCSDGHGGEAFYRALNQAASPQELLQELANVPRSATEPDQWQYQILARIQSQYKVIIVTRHCDHDLLKAIKIDAAGSVEEALEMARKHLKKSHLQCAVIPDGVSVIALPEY